jgi:hypothetical protein
MSLKGCREDQGASKKVTYSKKKFTKDEALRTHSNNNEIGRELRIL